jgi:hypothetical protein
MATVSHNWMEDQLVWKQLFEIGLFLSLVAYAKSEGTLKLNSLGQKVYRDR